ncbi:MAG: aldehyde dehydrogenase family protein, partial [Proteobacteria bacterium]|nr:aldehyde dehydrogenase family protein [Pseudomonadota bacterium]
MELKDPALFRQECYINGAWVTAQESFEVVDPADGRIVGRVPSLGQEATKQTIAAASAAYPAWKALTAKERSAILKRWYALIVEHQNDLAMIMTREQGKPLAEAAGEVLYGASYIEWFAEEAKRVYGDTIPTTQKGKRI